MKSKEKTISEMTGDQNDFRTIVDFIYNSPELPDDLRRKIDGWLLAHEHDTSLSDAMSGLWTEHLESEHGSFDSAGLLRLLSEVDTPARRPWWKRVWRYAAAAVVAIAVSAGVYNLGTCNASHQTVLLVAAGAKGEYMLPDSTKVWLNGGTTLCYNDNDFTQNSRRVKVDGEAYFEVTKDSSRPFTVEMTDMEVEVLGTCFDVRNYSFSRTEEIVLKEGSVRVNTSRLVSPLILEPDQRMILDRRDGSVSVSNESAMNYCSWYQPRMRFEGMCLGDILTRISRRYSLDLEVSPLVNTDLLLSLTVYNDDADEVMRAIAYLASVRYTIEDNTLKVEI